MSPKKRTKAIRKNKHRANRVNLKKNEQRMRENIQVLQRLEAADASNAGTAEE